MGKVLDKPRYRKGGAFPLLLFFMLLFIAGEILFTISFNRKISILQTRLTQAQEKQKSLKKWKQKAILSVDAISTLNAWETATPLSSFFVKKLQNPEKGLQIEALSISRYFVLKSLPEDEQVAILPNPIQPFFLFDKVEFSIYETASGSGVLTFPHFRSRFNEVDPPLKYERTSSVSPYASKGDIPPPNLWIFYSEIPPYPLWKNALEVDP